MNELMRNTITSMEVAKMTGKQHCDLLKDIRRYAGQLIEGKIPLNDFFTENSYVSENGRTLPCYLVSKKGCEFIAHKLTGQKGTEFTARYINRFHEMEEGSNIISTEKVPVGEVAKLTNVMDRIAVRENLAPHRIAANFKAICEQFGVRLTDDFVKTPEYEQMSFSIKEAQA